MNPEQFYQELEKYQITLDDNQKGQFETYYELLVEWNKNINLTAITDKNEVYLKHFFDSILLGVTEKFENEIKTLCDVGSGAGFPSIPLKIIYPHLEVTIVDSLNKRILFLQKLTQTLGLQWVHLYHDRAETFGQKKEFRETFDYVTARAVARLNILSELCVPLIKKEGLFLALKASKMQEEVEEAKPAIALLGGKLIDHKEYKLPITGDVRYIVMIEKRKETPKKYPRKPGTPAKQPLV